MDNQRQQSSSLGSAPPPTINRPPPPSLSPPGWTVTPLPSQAPPPTGNQPGLIGRPLGMPMAYYHPYPPNMQYGGMPMGTTRPPPWNSMASPLPQSPASSAGVADKPPGVASDAPWRQRPPASSTKSPSFQRPSHAASNISYASALQSARTNTSSSTSHPSSINVPMHKAAAPGIRFSLAPPQVGTAASAATPFASVHPPSSPQKSQAKPAEPEWPPSLKAYVGRCFAECANDVDRDRMEALLRTKIQSAITSNQLGAVDWNNEATINLGTVDGDSIVSRAGVSGYTSGTKAIPGLALAKVKGRADLGKTTGVKKGKTILPIQETAEEQQRRLERARRFSSKLSSTPSSADTVGDAALRSINPQASEVLDWDVDTILGTCTNIEKRYLRLTSAPSPSTVRPLHILVLSLAHIKARWGATRDYGWACDQLKAVRQDLVVQRISNAFTIEVYETHARLALETGDPGEFVQCQSQLKQLYEVVAPERKDGQGHSHKNQNEFIAYRILYHLGTQHKPEINALLSSLTLAQKQSSEIAHALSVHHALASSNYHLLLSSLYPSAPLMSGYLMDIFINRERRKALKVICTAYRPSVQIKWLEKVLGFEGEEECLLALKEAGAVLIDGQKVDTKATMSLNTW